MKTLVAALALASQLVGSTVWAQSASTMTLRDFRLHNEQARTYMVLGAIALTGTLEVACPQPISIAEWQAALQHRPLDVSKPWVATLLQLMDERGCGGQQVKADT